MRDAFVRVLTEQAALNRRLLLITGDLGFGVLTEFARAFPDQYLNVGVAEQAMTGIAAGLALEGRTVITYSIGNFPTLRCLEQIRNDICYHKANVKIVAVGGGMSYGQLGMTHHATEDLAVMRSLPGMTVVAPGDTWEAEHLTRAILKAPGPCYLRLDKSFGATESLAGESCCIGKFRVVRKGSDVTILAVGGILCEAQGAAEILAADGISARVVSAHSVKPLDGQALRACAMETRCVVVVEEHALDGGFGGAVAEWYMDDGIIPSRFVRIGLRNEFASAIGTQTYLRTEYGLDAMSISRAISAQFKDAKFRAA